MFPRIAAPLAVLAFLLTFGLGPASSVDASLPRLDAHPHVGREAVIDSHADGSYDIPVWFNWGQYVLDVWVVPPGHGQLVNDNGVLGGLQALEATPLNSYLAATLDSIDDWKRAVQLFGSSSLRTQLKINVYVVGLDLIPPNTDPEVVILSDETKGPILGVAFSSNPCLVVNSKIFLADSFTYADYYNVNGQEFGHCLGLNHVSGGHPTHDVMNGAYPHSPGTAATKLHCISNLDVAGLERVFTGQGGSASLPVAQWATTRWTPACEL